MHAYLFTGEKTVQQTIVELNTCGSIRAVCGSLYSVCPAGQRSASGSLHAAATVSVGDASAKTRSKYLETVSVFPRLQRSAGLLCMSQLLLAPPPPLHTLSRCIIRGGEPLCRLLSPDSGLNRGR